jgi:hypothetical protein
MKSMENYSKDEIQQLVKLSKESGGKSFSSAEAFLQYVQRL